MSTRLYLDFFGYYLPAAVGILCFLFGLALLLTHLERRREWKTEQRTPTA